MMIHHEQTTQAAQSFQAMFGWGWKTHLAEALGMNIATLTNQINNGKMPLAAVIALEFLQATPPKKWPARYDTLKALKKKHETA